MEFYRNEIDGSRVVYEFTILREGWEMDNKGWVTEDGNLFTTNHGSLCSLKPEELNQDLKNTQKSLDSILAAQSIALHHCLDTDGS